MTVELAHDIIALKIWEQLPEQDKQLRLVSHSLNQRLKDFNRGDGSLLGEKELLAWEDFFPLLALTEFQVAYILQSKEAVRAAELAEQAQRNRELRLTQQKLVLEQKTRRRQRIYLGVFGILAIVSILASLMAMQKSETAEKNKLIALEKQEQAENNAREMSLVVQNLAQTRAEELFELIEVAKQKNDFYSMIIHAKAVKATLQEKEQKIKHNTDNKEIINSFIQAIKPANQRATDYIADYQHLVTENGKGKAYEQAMLNIDRAITKKDFDAALKFHAVANDLAIDMMAADLAQKKLAINNTGFQYYFNLAKRDFNRNRSKRGKYITPYQMLLKAAKYANTAQKQILNNWFQQHFCYALLDKYVDKSLDSIYEKIIPLIKKCNE